METRGYITDFVAVEVGGLGHYFSKVYVFVSAPCPSFLVSSYYQKAIGRGREASHHSISKNFYGQERGVL